MRRIYFCAKKCFARLNACRLTEAGKNNKKY